VLSRDLTSVLALRGEYVIVSKVMLSRKSLTIEDAHMKSQSGSDMTETDIPFIHHALLGLRLTDRHVSMILANSKFENKRVKENARSHAHAR
jgi:hypothetical protein